MFSSQAQSAYSTLQDKALSATDNYTLDRVDRALDEIVRNPGNTNPAHHQVRSAWANAGKVLHNRRQLAPQVSIDAAGVEPTDTDGGYDVVEVIDWLDHAAMSGADRHVLRGLTAGGDAQTLAAADGVAVARMRERISRARRAGLTDYRVSVVAA